MNLTADQHPGSDKKAARAAVRSWRRALDPIQREQLGQDLARTVIGYLSQSTGVVQKVAAYCSGPDEPPTEALLDALVNEGIDVYLPVCEPDYALSWVEYTPGMEFAPSALAPVMEPVGERIGTELFDEINTLIMPALSIDEDGLRLGQGGGYYDRFLPLIENAPVRVAAVVYEHEYVPPGAFRIDEHDQPVDLVFTPQQVHQII